MNTISRIEKETRKRKILVVDDEQINRLLLEKMLEEEYEILLAANGKEALDIIKQEYKTLSIILLDLLMPVMTCFELLETMQTEKRYKNIPVIVLTSERSAEIRSLQLGAVDFIPKPYD
ncbi:MAG: response regulator, partial [Clostridia bacterium]|nr:response regulator [Clostridia bacterium]